jgi:hypothetical protein
MLLLRQSCQPILDTVGLSDFHTTIQNKCLTIVGPCGQPLVSIGGIQFAKSTISSDEREFATELFAKFIDKHGTAIVDYVTQKQHFNTIEKPSLPDGAYGTNTNGNRIYVSFPTDLIRSENASTNNMNIFANGDISFNTTVDINKLIQNLPTLHKMISDTEAYIIAHKAYKAEEKRINEMQQTISSCAI